MVYDLYWDSSMHSANFSPFLSRTAAIAEKSSVSGKSPIKSQRRIMDIISFLITIMKFCFSFAGAVVGLMIVYAILQALWEVVVKR